MLKRRKRGVDSRKRLYGFLFVLPWIAGVLIFFLIPLIQSVWFSLTDVGIGATGGFETSFNSFSNFKFIFTEDAKFTTNLRDSLISLAYSLPIIVILSLIFAVILVQKFKGRLIARAIFFLPVIIATGVVMTLLTTPTYGQPIIMSVTGEGNTYAEGMIDFNVVLGKLNFSPTIVALFSEYISRIFNLVWSIGVQVILFISGLQTIPAQLYEVSTVEGASKWEEFWYVTIPMLKNIILLVTLFTMIELFLAADNPVVKQAYNLINAQIYDRSSAMLWSYFGIAILAGAAILGIYYRACLRRWE